MAYSGPRIKLRANVRIPARTVPGPAISNTIEDGTQTIGLTLVGLDSAGTIANPSLFRIPIYNDATSEWEYTTLDNVPTTTTGDGRTGRGDSNYVILNTDRYLGLTAALTAPRTWTLPAASAVPAGTRMSVADEIGGISSTNTLTFGVTGADTINGASTFVLNAPRAGIVFRSDGTSKWSAGLITTSQLADGALAASTAGLAKMADGFLAASAAGRAKMADGFLSADATGRAKVADKFVTLAKMDDIATASFIARVTAGTGAPEVVSFAAGVLAGLPAGSVLQTLSNEYTANADLSTTTPVDDTTPTSTEGVQVCSQAITLASSANKVRVEFSAVVGSGAAQGVTAALFRGTTCINTQVISLAANGVVALTVPPTLDAPATTGSVTYSVRVGPQSSAVRLNGSSSGRLGGGAAKATLMVQEIKG